MSIFDPIQLFADAVTYRMLDLSPDDIFGEVVDYFIFDTIKITLLLVVIIFVISILRTFLVPQKIHDIFVRKNASGGYMLAAAMGMVTPFCSCSAVSLFMGLAEAGVPLGMTFTFLVASPMINEVALALLLGSFGVKIALLYIGSGFVIAIMSGVIIGRCNVAHLMERLSQHKAPMHNMDNVEWRERVQYASTYTKEIITKTAPYIILGVAIGAWIHGYVPEDFLAHYAQADKWYAVPLAILVGVPLYANAASIMPVVQVLFAKGVAFGTILAFMMAVTALSFPEFLILRRIMRPRLIGIFAVVVSMGIIFTGYLFNAII